MSTNKTTGIEPAGKRIKLTNRNLSNIAKRIKTLLREEDAMAPKLAVAILEAHREIKAERSTLKGLTLKKWADVNFTQPDPSKLFDDEGNPRPPEDVPHIARFGNSALAAYRRIGEYLETLSDKGVEPPATTFNALRSAEKEHREAVETEKEQRNNSPEELEQLREQRMAAELRRNRGSAIARVRNGLQALEDAVPNDPILAVEAVKAALEACRSAIDAIGAINAAEGKQEKKAA
jgi:hypothetical protein